MIRILADKNLSRRGFLTLGSLSTLASLGLAGTLSGCSAGSTSPGATNASQRSRMAPENHPDGQMESSLNLYSWGDYDDPDYIREWSDAHSCVVQVDAYGSNEELIAKLGATRGTSGYDIVVPSGLMIPQMVEHNLLQPLDHSLLPNLKNLDHRFQGLSFDPGNKWSVTKCWGTTGYVYDRYALPGEYHTWTDFLELAKGPCSGKVALLEDAWEVCAIALGSMGVDLNTRDPQELTACRRILIEELAPHVKAYCGNASTAVIQGSFQLMMAFNGDARQGMMASSDPDRWAFVFPTPTANLWIDNWCIARGAPHPDAAHAFINDVLAPDASAQEADYMGYATGVKGINAADFDYPDLIFPQPEILDRLTEGVNDPTMQDRVDMFLEAKTRSGA